MIGAGVGLIAISILTGGIVGGIAGVAIGGSIGLILGSSIIGNQIDDIIKGEHDRVFPNSYDVGFFEFLKSRKKIRKFKFFDLVEICGKYDLDYHKKKLIEDQKNFKNEFIKKFRKIGVSNKELEDLEKIEQEEEKDETENNKTPKNNYMKNNINNNKNSKKKK